MLDLLGPNSHFIFFWTSVYLQINFGSVYTYSTEYFWARVYSEYFGPVCTYCTEYFWASVYLQSIFWVSVCTYRVHLS